MPEDIANQISDVFNAIGFAVLKTILLYIAGPFIAIILVSRFVFNIKGFFLKVIMFGATIGCFYFFITIGLPGMQEIYESNLNRN